MHSDNAINYGLSKYIFMFMKEHNSDERKLGLIDVYNKTLC
jgi:hypothetical protein